MHMKATLRCSVNWSASLYASNTGLLLPRLLPFRRRTHATDPRFTMWVLRYERGGEHLKFRFRGQPAFQHEISRHFEAEVTDLLTNHPPRPDAERRAAEDLPPIDLEDQASGLRPDRCLVWTTYRFEPTHVGGEPLSEAEGFEDCYRRCLEAATGRMFDRLETEQAAGDSAWPSLDRRMGWATELFLSAGIEMIGNIICQRPLWLFSRDWLLRVTPDPTTSLARITQRATLRPKTVARLRSRSEAILGDRTLLPWRRAVRALRKLCLITVETSHIDQLSGTERRAYLWVMSRLLHNAVNPLQLHLSNEAYLAQLLADASDYLPRERTCA